MTTCQPSGATRRAICSSTSLGTVSTRRLTKLKRAPRTPAASSAASSPSLMPAATVGRLQRIDQGAVVRAVTGGLHDDVALEPEIVPQPEELRVRRIAGRIPALAGVGKLG